MTSSKTSIIVGTSLMPLSQAVAWYMVLREVPLLAQVWKIALFHCLWALYNRFSGALPNEMGHLTMGFMAWTAYFHHPRAALAGAALVLLNFALAMGAIISMTTKDMALKVKQRDDSLGMLWARTFQVYVASNLALWARVLSELWKKVY